MREDRGPRDGRLPGPVPSPELTEGDRTSVSDRYPSWVRVKPTTREKDESDLLETI